MTCSGLARNRKVVGEAKLRDCFSSAGSAELSNKYEQCYLISCESAAFRVLLLNCGFVVTGRLEINVSRCNMF